MNQKALWTTLVIAQIALLATIGIRTSWLTVTATPEVFLASLTVVLVSIVFLLIVRKLARQGKTVNNYALTGLFISSVIVGRYLGEISAFGGYFGAALIPFFYVASIIFSVVYGILIFRKKR